MTTTKAKPGAAAKARTIGVRFYQVKGDTMEPTIRRLDFVLLAPVSRYDGEGYYLVNDAFGEPAVYSCSGAGTRAHPAIGLNPHNTRYSGSIMPKAKFDEYALGKVLMICNVVDHCMMREVVQ